jgi:hypothetical protein
MAAQSTELGEEGNSPATVVNWGGGRVRWLRDDLAQQARPSIYRDSERWPRIWRRTRGDRRRGRALVQRLGVQRRGSYSGEPRKVAKVHGDTVETLRYVAQGRKTVVHRRAYPLKPQSRRGYGGESPEWRPVHGVMIFYPAMLSINSRHGSSRRWHESRWRIGHRRWGLPALAVWSDQALYHGNFGQMNLTANLGAKFSLKLT